MVNEDFEEQRGLIRHSVGDSQECSNLGSLTKIDGDFVGIHYACLVGYVRYSIQLWIQFELIEW